MTAEDEKQPANINKQRKMFCSRQLVRRGECEMEQRRINCAHKAHSVSIFIIAAWAWRDSQFAAPNAARERVTKSRMQANICFTPAENPPPTNVLVKLWRTALIIIVSVAKRLQGHRFPFDLSFDDNKSNKYLSHFNENDQQVKKFA